MSLPVAVRIESPSQVGLDFKAFGISVKDVESADVRGPGGPNAVVPMMERHPMPKTKKKGKGGKGY